MLADSGRVADAVRELEQALAHTPSSADLHYIKAQLAMESGDASAALQDLKRVTYLQPDFVLAHYLIGVLHSERARHEEARRHFAIVDELLQGLKDDEPIPGADGLHAGYLRESIRLRRQKESR